MSTSSNKQLRQVNNIFKTLIEATEHFHSLIKAKELNQSIFIFSSIVDGFGAVGDKLTSMDKEQWVIDKNKTEKYLLGIARLLQIGNFIKISEILQFTLLPLLKKLAGEVTQEIGDQTKEKYTIGVFASFHNPRSFYPEARMNALITESERQHAKLLFFTSNDVDFEKNEITADTCTNGRWERIKAPFPDVINNVGAGRRSRAERKLRRFIPFTSFHVGNKLTLPMRLVKYKKFAELLVPFRLCRAEAEIHAFLENNNRVVFKYLLGNRGENIYFVTKKGTRYTLQEHKKERIVSQETFNEWLQAVILKEKGSFIVQRYIHTRTKENEPYHFRAHVQKNGDGEWVLTHIYPRVGNRKSNLSNVATDGRVDNFHDFLQREYGEAGTKHEENILRLSLEIAQHLDKLYGLALDELGIDLAIDENGRYWMHEANNGPQTAYHEEKRAVNTIAYAKYIVKNGIVHTDSIRKAASGMFQARTTKITYAGLDNRITIGVLLGKIVHDSLAIALAETASKENMRFFTFTPKDVDYDEMLIKGYFYENDEWIPKVVEYPDVIMDLLKLRGDSNAQWIYEELEEIPFTNEWAGRQHKRSEIYGELQSSEKLNDMLVPYQKVNRTRDIFRYIERYDRVLLKPEIGNILETQYIERLANGKYTVTKGNSIKEYNELPLLNKFKELIKENSYIVQKDASTVDKNGQLFTICTHLIPDEERKWKFISLYSNIRAHSTGTATRNYTEELTEFLQENCREKDATTLENQIKEASQRIVLALQGIYSDVSEIAIVLGINENQQLSLIEVNPNGPGTVHDASKYAENVIAYADYLGTSGKDTGSLC